MTNFDYIKIVFKVSTSNAKEGVIIIPTDTLVNSTDNVNNTFRCGIGARVNSNSCVRYIYIKNATTFDQLSFGTANTPGAANPNNAVAIPLQINGLK